MQVLRKCFDFYVFANIHVAIAAASLTKITLIQFGIEANIFPFFVFFSTVLSYNFIRLFRMPEVKSWIYEWIVEHKFYLYFLIVFSTIGLFYYGLKLNKEVYAYLIPFVLLTIFYAVPFRVVGSTLKSLRALSGFKIFIIAFCWAGITVLLPLINGEQSISFNEWLTFLQRFLFVLVITIPFDIRDLQFDSENLKTIPQLVGASNAKRLGIVLLMLFLGLNFVKDYIASRHMRIEFIIALITLFFLIRSKDNQGKYYSAFFVEAIPIVWLLIVIALE